MSRAVASGLALMLACAAPAVAKPAYQLVSQGIERAVTETGLVVTPDREWNVLFNNKAEAAWTLDGRSLNEVYFYGGVPDGKSIWKAEATRSRPKPKYDKFSKAMTPDQIAGLFVATWRATVDFDEFVLSPTERIPFAGVQGFRFGYVYRYKDKGLMRQGEAAGAVIDGKLVMITYHTPRLFYFERGLPAFRALVASARMTAIRR